MFDGDVTIAWVRYGTLEEPPDIDHRKEREQGVVRRPEMPESRARVDQLRSG